VKTLLRADYKWVLSEYEGTDGMYRPLGEPIRIPVYKSHHAGGTGELVEECLWSNFDLLEAVERTKERIKKQMPVVDTAKLIETLETERADIDAAIRALQRTVARNFPPPPKAAARKAARKLKAGSKAATKKKGRTYTPAQKAAMSEKLKAAWRERKGQRAAPKKATRKRRKKEEGGEAAMTLKA